MTTQFKLKRGLSADWTAINPVLADGEPGWATDIKILKIGDGVSRWNDLQPVVDSNIAEFQQVIESLLANDAEQSDAINKINILLDTVNDKDAIISLKELATWVENYGSNSILYTPQQLTSAEQEQARKNIGAAAIGEGGGSADLSNVYTKQEADERFIGYAEFSDAVDIVLAEAKESGEFQGEAGPQGPKGEPGEQGIQGDTGPQGAPGATGEKGEPGVDGVSITSVEINDSGELIIVLSNGITSNLGTIIGPKGDQGPIGPTGDSGIPATHNWNGTILTVTSASGSSSADLKGEKGDQGPKGDTGPQGPKGDSGITIVDQVYNANSEYAQSGKAVSEAITPIQTNLSSLTDNINHMQEVVDDFNADIAELYDTTGTLERNIGDIDSALDRIIEIQNSLLLPELDEVSY